MCVCVCGCVCADWILRIYNFLTFESKSPDSQEKDRYIYNISRSFYISIKGVNFSIALSSRSNCNPCSVPTLSMPPLFWGTTPDLSPIAWLTLAITPPYNPHNPPPPPFKRCRLCPFPYTCPQVYLYFLAFQRLSVQMVQGGGNVPHRSCKT